MPDFSNENAIVLPEGHKFVSFFNPPDDKERLYVLTNKAIFEVHEDDSGHLYLDADLTNDDTDQADWWKTGEPYDPSNLFE